MSCLDAKKSPYLYNYNDFNHINQPDCVFFCEETNITENIKHSCCIGRLCECSNLWIQKKNWLALDCRSYCHVFQNLYFILYFLFFSSDISADKLLLLLETWQSSKLWYSGSTFLWMHALNNLDSCHPYQELVVDFLLLCQGERGCARAALPVLSPVDCAKCTSCVQM